MYEYSTQINEVLNYSQVCLTPKAKTFHEIKSFNNRDATCIGVHNQGMSRYWTSTFDCVGVPYTTLFTSFLERVDKKRKRWKEWHGKYENKRNRAHRQEAVSKQTLCENQKKEYESGIGLDIRHKAEPRKKRTRKKRDKCRCGATTHLMVTSKECPLNKKRKAQEVILCQPVNEESKEKNEETDVVQL